jgi:hypothetical protein
MADTSAIASLLHEFIASIDSEAGAAGDDTASTQPKPPAAQFDRRKALETQVAKLTPEDQEAFHRILKELRKSG